MKIGDTMRLTTEAVIGDKGYMRGLKGFTVKILDIITTKPVLKLGIPVRSGTLIVTEFRWGMCPGDGITHVNGHAVTTAEDVRSRIIQGENELQYIPMRGSAIAFAYPIVRPEPPENRYRVEVQEPADFRGTIYTVCEGMLKPLVDNSVLLNKITGEHDFTVYIGSAHIDRFTIPTELPDGEYTPVFLSVKRTGDIETRPEPVPLRMDNPIDSLISISLADLVTASKFCDTGKEGALACVHIGSGFIDATDAHVGTRIPADTGVLDFIIPAKDTKTLALLGERIIYAQQDNTSVYIILNTGATYTYRTEDKYPTKGLNMIVNSEAHEVKDYKGYIIPEDQHKLMPKKYNRLTLHDGGTGSAAKILYFHTKGSIIYTTVEKEGGE